MGFELRRGKELATISRELRKMNEKAIAAKWRKELRQAARPLVPLVRAQIRAIPSTRGRYRRESLRGAMSKATRLEVQTRGKGAGMAIRVDGRKMPSHTGTLPAYMEGSKKRWRHPVFGHRESWASQPPHPYFFRTVVPAAGPLARSAVNRVLDGITRSIT